jgi:hypothetical protein
MYLTPTTHSKDSRLRTNCFVWNNSKVMYTDTVPAVPTIEGQLSAADRRRFSLLPHSTYISDKNEEGRMIRQSQSRPRQYIHMVLIITVIFLVVQLHFHVVVAEVSAANIVLGNHNYGFHIGSNHQRGVHGRHAASFVALRGGGEDESCPSSMERFQMDADANPEKISYLPPGNDTIDTSNMNDHVLKTDSTATTSTIVLSSAENKTTRNVDNKDQSFYSPQHRQMTRSDERAILGRAVLTMPHRRMPAVLISTGPRPIFVSPTNPGPVFTATPIFVTKFSLCEALGCALRDLRVIDQFSTNGRYSGPAFLARTNCVIVNVGHVRAIVMRNQVLIFLPEVSGVLPQRSSSSSNTRNSSSSNRYKDASTLDDLRGEDSIQSPAWSMLEGTRSEANSDLKLPSTTMDTIHLLVEALVTHLNSIYHAAPHHMFDDDIISQHSEGVNGLQPTISGNNPNGGVKNSEVISKESLGGLKYRSY